MKKNRHQILIHWLKQQSIISQRWLNISHLLGMMGGLLTIAQAWLLARSLQYMIVSAMPPEALLIQFSMLMLVLILRAVIALLRERVNFYVGRRIRYNIRRQILDKLAEAGPSWIYNRPEGSWTTLILEQIDNLHDYYARYLPQVVMTGCIPLLIVITITPINWIAAIILLLTAPLILFFITLVGMGAADANRRNFLALSRLGAHFLDRLRGMETLRVFGRGEAETENIRLASQNFRQRTMEVLRLVFLSSGVLEFFTSLSIAMIAIYFGFSYLGAIDFGHHSIKITFSAGFLTLILAREFFQPLRDLGAFYHAKAKAIGAADDLKTFIETPISHLKRGKVTLNGREPVSLVAEDFSVLSPKGSILVGPLNFTLIAGQRVGLIGASGSGKSSLLNAIFGFMAYTGSLRINGTELRALDMNTWRTQLSWVGQDPQLPASTLRDNVLLGRPDANEDELQLVLNRSWVSEFLPLLPNGIETVIGDQGVGLSVGQAQRIAVARALLHPCRLLLLDEPAANLDKHSEQRVMQALGEASHQQTTLMITHQFDSLVDWDNILVMDNGRIVEQGSFSALTATQGYLTNLLAIRQEDSNASLTTLFSAI